MELILSFLPDGVGLISAGLILAVAFFTAALTAAFGLGGGLALLAAMSALLPAPAVVPVHGVAQLGSNAGRFYLQRKDVLWPIVLWFSLGGLIGILLGGRLALEMPVWALRLGVGMFVLFTVWGPKPASFSPGLKSWLATGAIGGFLTMFFGATGPIAATMLRAADVGRLNTVATHAACMVFQHGLKIVVFGALGFAFAEWIPFAAAIVIVGFAGTALGTDILRRMPEATFKRGFKYLLTAIAIYLIVAGLSSIRTG